MAKVVETAQTDAEKVKIIQPVVLRTDNVAKELKRVAYSYKVPLSSLDFKILSLQTFIKSSDENSEDWIELDSNELEELNDNPQLLHPNFYIKQTYEIEIYSLQATAPLNTLKVSIGANSNLTKVYLTIMPSSTLKYYNNFFNDFITLINKKKLRASLMINIFDSHMAEAVHSIEAKLKVNNEMFFEKKEILQVAQAIEPLPTVNDELILHYEKKRADIKESDRVDYSKRGYILSVVKDEILIEYIKANKGKAGRNCKGQFLEPKEPIVSHEPTFNVSDKISIEETNKNILYRAKVNGYVTFENATYDIKCEVDVSEISFKTTGSIETDLDADVSINVKEADVLKDAIGMGMEVEVNEIHVEGNVGPNAKIHSVKAVIEGQTHKSSFIESDVLSINIHKGKAKGREVHITRLEHGEIEADKVSVSQALGGKIKAREINIATLGSHVKLIASHTIVIDKLQGGENTFIIDPLISNESRINVENSMKIINEEQKKLDELEAEVKHYEKLIQDNEASYIDIKKRLIHYKKNAIKMPVAFVKKYKEFHSYYEYFNKLKSEFIQKQETLELMQEKFNSTQNDIFEARIINNDRWRNHNEIIFKLIDPAMEVSFIPEHNSTIKILGLKERDEDYFIGEVSE